LIDDCQPSPNGDGHDDLEVLQALARLGEHLLDEHGRSAPPEN
jgi:hypothetical protein